MRLRETRKRVSFRWKAHILLTCFLDIEEKKISNDFSILRHQSFNKRLRYVVTTFSVTWYKHHVMIDSTSGRQSRVILLVRLGVIGESISDKNAQVLSSYSAQILACPGPETTKRRSFGGRRFVQIRSVLRAWPLCCGSACFSAGGS